jgi:alpha-ketoglutarate-dependent taurine dioxygenase
MNNNFTETIIESDLDFINLALSYGTSVKSRKDSEIIETLIALSSDQVENDSLTKRYGLNQFPIHTDCAYLKSPPKYIFLRYIGSVDNPTPTVLVHFDKSILSEEELDFVCRTIWYVKSKDKGFYSTIYKDDILRYDQEIMRIVNQAENKMDIILAKMKTTEIQWKKNKVVIINNHSTLHFRPQISSSENNKRILQRINIK